MTTSKRCTEQQIVKILEEAEFGVSITEGR